MNRNDRYFPYSRQSVDEADIEAVVAVLRSDFLTQGPAVETFERRLAQYCGAKFAVAFNSGTAALHAAYSSAGLKAGQSFVTSPLTFAASANAGVYLGAQPVFADIEADTGNLDVEALTAEMLDSASLIVPVHYAGQSVDMKSLSKKAKERGIVVIEDACHALGAKYEGSFVGDCRYSDMAVFSFHPVKPLTTGEGGAVLTNDADYYESLMTFRTHGITKKGLLNESDGDWYYEMQTLGYNYRLTDIQAALGSSQLAKLDGFIERRRALVAQYRKAFEGNPYFDIPVERDYGRSCYHLYPLRLKERYRRHKAALFKAMREKGLGVQTHYIPVYWHPFYAEQGFERGLCPKAEIFYRSEISIPLYQAMSDSDVDYVIGLIGSIFEGVSA